MKKKGSEDEGKQNLAIEDLFSDRTYLAMAETFSALSDPTRAKIIHILCMGESSVGNLAERTSVSPSAVSHQLRLLRQLGLVRFRRQGQSSIYALDDHHVALLFREAHEHVGEFLLGRREEEDQ